MKSFFYKYNIIIKKFSIMSICFIIMLIISNMFSSCFCEAAGNVRRSTIDCAYTTSISPIISEVTLNIPQAELEFA